MDGIHNYSCKCPAGYTGGNCQTGKFLCLLLFTLSQAWTERLFVPYLLFISSINGPFVRSRHIVFFISFSLHFHFHYIIKLYNIKCTVCLRPQIAKANRGGRSCTQSVVKVVIIKLSFNKTTKSD